MEKHLDNWKLKAILIYNFALQALLLNCVGIVILNLNKYNHVSPQSSSYLESFKDISMLIGSILLISYIAKSGYKKTLLVGVFLEFVACVLMGLYPTLFTARGLFYFGGSWLCID